MCDQKSLVYRRLTNSNFKRKKCVVRVIRSCILNCFSDFPTNTYLDPIFQMQPYVYNRERRKRPGVFQNPVYSKVVCAADDPSVRKGVSPLKQQFMNSHTFLDR